MRRKNFLLVLFYTDTFMVNRENPTCLTSFRVQALSTKAVSYDESSLAFFTAEYRLSQQKNKNKKIKILFWKRWADAASSHSPRLDAGSSALRWCKEREEWASSTADDAIWWSYLFICLYLRVAGPGFLKPLDYKQVFHRRSCSCRTTFGFLTAVSSSKEISPPILHQCTALTLTASPPIPPPPFSPILLSSYLRWSWLWGSSPIHCSSARSATCSRSLSRVSTHARAFKGAFIRAFHLFLKVTHTLIFSP